MKGFTPLEGGMRVDCLVDFCERVEEAPSCPGSELLMDRPDATHGEPTEF